MRLASLDDPPFSGVIDFDERTTGVPSPDRPGVWLVPPWRADASFCEVVRHFLRSQPGDNASTQHLLAYYRRYQTALEAAPTHDLTFPDERRWVEEMRACVGRCATLYRDATRELREKAS